MKYSREYSYTATPNTSSEGRRQALAPYHIHPHIALGGILLTDSEGGAIPLIIRLSIWMEAVPAIRIQEFSLDLSKADGRARMPPCQEAGSHLSEQCGSRLPLLAADGLANCTVHGDGEHGHGNDESRISHGSFLAGIPRSLCASVGAHRSACLDPVRV